MADEDHTATADTTPGPAEGAPDAEDLPKVPISGRYRIERRIATGGMGVVYAGRDLELGRPVALKLIRPRAESPRAQDRFVREARAMAKLRHPSVVTVYDLGKVGDQYFIVMELVEGGTLTEWLKAEPRTWRQIVPLFLQAAQALAAAHAAGIVHRDFKSENVLLDSDGRVRVTDFGVVRLLGVADEPRAEGAPAAVAGATGSVGVVGTPGYIAPEVLADEEVDARADQFTFCVALYAALYGRRPFKVDPESSPLYETLGELQPAPPGATPRWLHPIIVRGLSREPSDRWPTISALTAEIDRHLGSSDRIPSRSRRWQLVALSLAAALAGAVWLASRSGRKEAAAHQQRVDRQLTADPPRPAALVASVSRDGRLLAWSRGGSLTTRVMANGEEHSLALPKDVRLVGVSWFLDDVRLLAATTGPAGDTLQVISADGGAPVELARSARRPSLSPDGRTIAFLRDPKDQPEEVWLIDADGAHPRKLVGVGTMLEGFSLLVWSPDGRMLAVVDSATGVIPRLRIVGVDGRLGAVVAEDRDLADVAGGVASIWLLDGRLVFAHRQGRGTVLWAIHIDPTSLAPQGEPAQIAAFEDYELRIHSLDDQGDLLTSRMSLSDVGSLLDLSADGSAVGEPRRVTEDDWPTRLSSFSADSSFLFFQSFRDGHWQGFRGAIAGGANVAQSAAASDALEVCAAPGGEGLLWLEPVGVADSTSRRFLKTSADGVTRLVRTLGPWPRGTFVTLRCARRAGRGCVLRRAGNGQATFEHIDPDSGATVEIPAKSVAVFDPVIGWDLSPEGDEIVYPTAEYRIVAIAVADGSTRLDLPQTGDFIVQSVAYDASGQGFITTGMTGTDPMYHLTHVDRRGAARAIWANAADWLSNPIVSPDGRHVAFTRRAFSENLWLLSGL